MHGILFPPAKSLNGLMAYAIDEEKKSGNVSNEIKDVLDIMKLGPIKDKIEDVVNNVGGPIVAKAMAFVLKSVFLAIMCDAYFNRDKAKEFFLENFEIDDDTVPGGKRYYEGKFLFRTDRPGDNMNVLLKFCHDPDALFDDDGYVDPDAVVSTKTLEEHEADKIEEAPDKVDFVIYFKDIAAMIGLIGMKDLDPITMLMNNVMHVKGNAGQIGKFGSIATNIVELLKEKGVPIPV